jgi:Domain of unknown function (DUF6249)
MADIAIEVGNPVDAGELQSEIRAAVGGHESDVPSSPIEDLVPIVLFLAIALTYCVKYYFAHRTRQDVQSTVRVALERGDPLTPDLLDRLVQAPPPKRTDLRRGVIGIVLGIGLGAFGLVVGEPDAVRPMLAVGVIPLLLGLAYLILWRLGGDKA